MKTVALIISFCFMPLTESSCIVTRSTTTYASIEVCKAERWRAAGDILKTLAGKYHPDGVTVICTEEGSNT